MAEKQFLLEATKEPGKPNLLRFCLHYLHLPRPASLFFRTGMEFSILANGGAVFQKGGTFLEKVVDFFQRTRHLFTYMVHGFLSRPVFFFVCEATRMSVYGL
ncbi:MAG: hypothetical protein IJ892_08045 [Prevotella sp.]|nr:hypothetical protein [Prevotella sp.]